METLLMERWDRVAGGQACCTTMTPIKKTRIGRCGFSDSWAFGGTSPSRRPASAAHDYSRAGQCG
ncbi:hypothetical protein XcuCFBP2542_10580 [Xanthomonas cucurbitae]|uniref:Uncharacterized protein n=1 Tax=Xanthomonas cucurbitae TaxID=56453 RepID=A0A2S7DR44_9XANT|nr:hypothetical protein XcuCFBP2542_10580 [Xanthomonas cucurbitae]